VNTANYLSKTYSYGSQNNGNIVGIGNNKDSSRKQSLTTIHSTNQLMNQGSSLEDTSFTDAIRPRTGEVVPPCQNCQAMFPQLKK
jgi:hypothetical protein